MPETLVERAPKVRCYECGSDEIFSVCHHCQKPMCQEHSPLAYREAGKLVREPSTSGDDAKPASREFAGLKLGGTKEAVYHCEQHAHVVGGPLAGVIGVGVGVAVLGVIILLFAPLPGLVLVLVGAALAGGAFGIRRMRESSAIRPPLPLVPHVNAVDVTERLTGSVRLENGTYTSTVEALEGEIKVNMSASDGSRLLQLYRRKYRLPDNQPVTFSAGFVMLEGEAGLEFHPGQQAVLADRTGVSVGADSADGHDLFPSDLGRTQGEWTFEVGYGLQDDRAPKDIPLWIVPSLVPATDRRTLEIDLHWNKLGPEGHELDLQMFDRIELEVPSGWGNVENVYPGRVEISRSGGRRVIKWQRLKPGDNDSRTRVNGSKSLTLQIRFERPIIEEPEPPSNGNGDNEKRKLTLSGTVEATFAGMLSGLTGVGIYLPGGGRGHKPETKPQTKVTVNFDVSLRTLRYQDDRVIPDENNADDRANARNKVDEFYGVVPDHRTVAELTNAISADDYYVKCVVEHPPYRDDGRPNVANRVWDIAGRRYDGVFPIDFDINLRGEEVGQGTSSTFAGRTAAQVTVKGAYAKRTAADEEKADDANGEAALADEEDAGDELLKQIENTWITLHDKVVRILADRAAFASAAKGIAAPAEDAPAEDIVDGEVVEHDDDAMSATVIVDAEVVAGEPVAARAGDDRTHRAADLRKQRQSADDAVVAGRISEDTYRRIIARIEAELDELRMST
jgi:hypothetical protein